jgi:hypothetical protein
MTDQAIEFTNHPQRDSEIELLAKKSDIPLDTVAQIYRAEHAKLEQTARIKTFLPVLAHRRVKEILRSRGARASA